MWYDSQGSKSDPGGASSRRVRWANNIQKDSVIDHTTQLLSVPPTTIDSLSEESEAPVVTSSKQDSEDTQQSEGNPLRTSQRRKKSISKQSINVDQPSQLTRSQSTSPEFPKRLLKRLSLGRSSKVEANCNSDKKGE